MLLGQTLTSDKMRIDWPLDLATCGSLRSLTVIYVDLVGTRV